MSLQYIIDGYNLFNHPLLSALIKSKADPAKTIVSLIRERKLTGSLKNNVTIVFDGFPPSGQSSIVSLDYITLLYSRKISADERIKNLVEQSARRKETVVVSDDREIRDAVKFLGAACLKIDEFVKQNKKMKLRGGAENMAVELGYEQKEKINRELRKLWLR